MLRTLRVASCQISTCARAASIAGHATSSRQALAIQPLDRASHSYPSALPPLPLSFEKGGAQETQAKRVLSARANRRS